MITLGKTLTVFVACKDSDGIDKTDKVLSKALVNCNIIKDAVGVWLSEDSGILYNEKNHVISHSYDALSDKVKRNLRRCLKAWKYAQSQEALAIRVNDTLYILFSDSDIDEFISLL